MKRLFKTILIFLLVFSVSPFFSSVKAINQITIHFFENQYCMNCQEMSEYLDQVIIDYENVNVISYEIAEDENLTLLEEVAEIFSINVETPTVVIGGLAFSGYNPQVVYDIEQTLDRYSEESFTDVTQKLINGEEILVSDIDTLERTVIVLPFIGEVEIESLSLFVSAVVLGFVDGFNPCAMWVLVFLISMMINMKDRKRMWIIGVTFIMTSALVYFLIMVSWLQVAVSLAAVNWFRYLIGAFALIFGGYNIYKYLKNRKVEVGCEVTDESQRSKLIEKIKSIVSKKNLWLALLGVIVLALSVNLIELACSAGLPLLYTQILAYNDLSTGMYFLYIGVYIFLFMIDDLVIFILAMITMRVTGISNRYTRYSSIIGGIIMAIIVILLIFFPNIIMFNF